MNPAAVEMLVVGAGPAGMEAAMAASERGVETAVIESLPMAGGQYFRRPFAPSDGVKPNDVEVEGAALRQRLESSPATTYFGALVWGLFKDNTSGGWLVAVDGPGAPPWFKAKAVVLANGAYDTPVAFPGWTLPGVITCGAALILAKSQHVVPGLRALVTGTGPLLLSAAAHLSREGMQVTAVCESSRVFPKRSVRAIGLLRQPGVFREASGYFGRLLRKRIAYKQGWSILEAFGGERVESARIGRVDARGYPIDGGEQEIQVDTVVCGYGLTPDVRLAGLVECGLEFRPEEGGWIPLRDPKLQCTQPGIFVVGDAGGIRGAENARLEGRQAGIAVAHMTGHLSEQQAAILSSGIAHARAGTRRYGHDLGTLFPPLPGWGTLAKEPTVLCRCEEVSVGEVNTAVREGARSLDVVKMVTRAGMGDCQGRMCQRLVYDAMLREMHSQSALRESAGRYPMRPPLHPLPLGSLAEADSGE